MIFVNLKKLLEQGMVFKRRAVYRIYLKAEILKESSHFINRLIQRIKHVASTQC